MVEASFPIVSFQNFISGSEAEKRAVAQELYNAFHTYGWIYLKDFGISADEIDEMFAAVSVTNSGGTSANVDRITEQEIL
tara:strand:- start:928 stop:1167 length:240 start_codon:yes stop_codon:yes gene_type:complete